MLFSIFRKRCWDCSFFINLSLMVSQRRCALHPQLFSKPNQYNLWWSSLLLLFAWWALFWGNSSSDCMYLLQPHIFKIFTWQPHVYDLITLPSIFFSCCLSHVSIPLKILCLWADLVLQGTRAKALPSLPMPSTECTLSPLFPCDGGGPSQAHFVKLCLDHTCAMPCSFVFLRTQFYLYNFCLPCCLIKFLKIRICLHSSHITQQFC